jgi:hypothetical protein
MGKLFLPKETKGLYDRANKTLTIFVSEEATIGFSGTPNETQSVRFSAWGNMTGERANEVYRVNATTLEANIDTSSPARLTFEATNGDGKALATSITILIRMRPKYGDYTPIGQYDSTACWAACLAWWLSVLADRPSTSQLDLIGKASGMWNKDGTINPNQLELFVKKNGFKMHTARIQPKDLKDYMGFWPLLIAFKAPGGFGHMNVLHNYGWKNSTVDAMEPWYPDPELDSAYTSDEYDGVPVYTKKNSGDPFEFKGAHLHRTYSIYGNNPLKGGYFWVGFPQEYLEKI